MNRLLLLLIALLIIFGAERQMKVQYIMDCAEFLQLENRDLRMENINLRNDMERMKNFREVKNGFN
jgi:hypothetical protein